MKWFRPLFCLLLVIGYCVLQAPAQVPDSVPRAKMIRSVSAASKDTGASKMKTALVADTSRVAQKLDSVALGAEWQLFRNHVGSTRSGAWLINKPVSFQSNDSLFYLLSGLVMMLGLIRYFFPKYYSDLFGLFFRVTLKQKAVRERLLENALPSILLNGLFLFSGGFFLYYVSKYYHWTFRGNFWYGLGFWILLLAVVYGFKLVLMRSAGWLFQIREASGTYSFIVFMINKVIGVLLIPVVILLAFGPAGMQPVLVTASVCLLAGMFLYRYVICYPSVRASVRVNQFHFFLYLCALEIVPLLIIYKALAVYFSNTAQL